MVESNKYYNDENMLTTYISSLLGGAYIGIGLILSYTVSYYLQDLPYAKIVAGLVFSLGLLLVLYIGATLFTGTCLTYTMYSLSTGRLLIHRGLLVWVFNLLGSYLIAGIYYITGLWRNGLYTYIITTLEQKMELNYFELIARGVICNILVCLAIFYHFKQKERDSGYNPVVGTILTIGCVSGFVLIGGEHSVANMTLFAMGSFLLPIDYLPTLVAQILNNLFYVTIGNVIGGCIVAFSYWGMEENKNNKNSRGGCRSVWEK